MATQTTPVPGPPDQDAAVRAERKRAAALEAELVALRRKLAEADAPKPPRETHMVWLANGDHFRTAAPVMTQHYVDGLGLVPVTAVYEITGEED